MHTPDQLRPGHEVAPETPPTEKLINLLESLGPNSVYGTYDASVVRTYLKYGSERELLAEYAEEHLAESAAKLTAGMLPYLRAGRPGYGIPDSIQADPSYSARPDYLDELGTTSSWLHCLKETDSPKPGEFASTLATMALTEFDADAYDALLQDIEAGHSLNARRMIGGIDNVGRSTAGIIASKLASYGSDPGLMRQYADSPYFKRFGNKRDELDLRVKVAQLEGCVTNNEHSDAYKAVIDLVTDDLTGSGYPSSHTGLRLIAEQTPGVIMDLVKRSPKASPRVMSFVASLLYEKGKDGNTLSEAHATLLGDIEAKAGEDFSDFLKVMAEKAKAKGAISPREAKHLAALAKNASDNFAAYFNNNAVRAGWLYPENFDSVLKSARALASRYIDDTELHAAIEADKQLAISADSKAIVIRRLAGLGDVQGALELVDGETTTIDSHAVLTEPIMNLLAIYDESGDEQALALAEEKIAALREKKLFGSEVYAEQGFAAQKYMAALKHGNEALAQEALSTIASCNRDNAGWENERSLRDTMQMFLDLGDIDAAYTVALEYRDASGEFVNRNAESEVLDIMMTMVQALVDADRHQEAAEITLEVFKKDRVTYDWRLLEAIEYIFASDKSKVYLPSLYGRHINPLNETL